MSNFADLKIEGKWKEEETIDSSNFLKAIGVSKTKRSLSKKIKTKLKYMGNPSNPLAFSNASQSGPIKLGPHSHVIGQPRIDDKPGPFGKTEVSSEILSENNVLTLLMTITIKELNKSSDAENLKIGDQMVSKIFKDGDKLKSVTAFVPKDLGGKSREDWLKETEMTKIFKYKGEAKNMEIEEDD